MARPLAQRLAALTVVAALMAGLSVPAFAATYNIGDGSITIEANGDGTAKVTQNETVNEKDDDVIVKGSGETTSNVIEVINNTEDDLKITLSDVDIADTKGKAPLSVSGTGDTTIELDGNNSLTGSGWSAGLERNEEKDAAGNVVSGKLTIQDENKNGSLEATGNYGGAGIGGGNLKNSGEIEITGGTITATGALDGAGIGGGNGYDGDVTISGNAKIENATGGYGAAGIGGGAFSSPDKIGNGNVVIKDNAKIDNVQGGAYGAGIGGGIYGLSNVTIEGNTKVNATGGAGGAAIGGGAGAENNSDNNGNQITIKSNENGSPTINAVGGGTDEGEEIVIGGAGIGAGCESDADADITLEGKVTITATAGKDNVAIGANGIEQEFSGLAEGSSITRYDSEGNDTSLPGDKVPVTPVVPDDTSSGGSADASVQESVFPGLVVTDKDGQRISYTSIRGNNVLSLRVGRFTASLRASLATLRQLRAEGIDTITFQTILCSTTLSVDELLAMGGEDTEVVLTHHIRSSTLTVGGKAV